MYGNHEITDKYQSNKHYSLDCDLPLYTMVVRIRHELILISRCLEKALFRKGSAFFVYIRVRILLVISAQNLTQINRNENNSLPHSTIKNYFRVTKKSSLGSGNQ